MCPLHSFPSTSQTRADSDGIGFLRMIRVGPLNPWQESSPTFGYYEMVASFYVENFGCRAAQADGAAIEQQFRERGLDRAPAPVNAGIVVLNTCTVTSAADQDARAAVRRIRRQNPGCQIVITGCYAQRAPQEVASLPGVNAVIGNSHKHQLADLFLAGNNPKQGEAAFIPISRLLPEQNEAPGQGQCLTADDRRLVLVSDIFAHTELQAAPVFDSANARTRPNLKVQDGCDNRCSFCVIPSVRGHSRSLPLDQILRQVNTLVEAGYREVVISGINLGRWGRDLPSSQADLSPHRWAGEQPVRGQRLATTGQRLENLVRAILNETPLEKLRISSVEPMDWSGELIALMAASPRIAKHAHVPMQSGSDSVLRRMHRKYRPWHYREKIEKIRAAMPSAAIGADVMTGFPGETGAEFEATRRMVDDLPLTYLHVFTYSARPGTPAAVMRDQVPVPVASERNRILRELAAEKKLAFMRSFIGKTIPAITLASRSNGRTEALTDNYLKLRLRGQCLPNHWISATISAVEDGSLVGSAAPNECSPRL